MYTLLYSVCSGEEEIGQVYVTHCPSLELANKLNYYGDEGWKFLEIVKTLFLEQDVTEINLILHQDANVRRHDGETICVVPWKLVYG